MERPAVAAFNPQRFRLGEVLVSRSVISDDQLQQALAHQKASGRKLGRAIMDLKFATAEAIAAVVADQLGIEFVDLNRRQVDPQVVHKLPEAQARRFRALVLAERPDGLEVGMVDPADMAAFDQLARLLKVPIFPAMITEDALLPVLERIYQRKAELSNLAQEVAADIGADVVNLSGIDANLAAEDAPVVRLLQSIFESAVSRDVSDVHIEPQERMLQIRFRIDGVMQVQSSPDSRIASAVVQRLKLMSGLDISEKRLPQDGRFRMKVRDAMLDVRISTLPTQYGEAVVMRLLAQNADRMKLDAIGIPPAILKRFRACLNASSGLILVTGPTGSGKTTTLYSALSEINTPETKIITAEDPVEYRQPGLNQVQVNDKVGLTFAKVLRSCLRQDPDVILVGEMRDQETAEIGLRAALTGHLVLSTLHTNDAAGTPMRLKDMGIAPYMVAIGLRLVIAQRLIRGICKECKGPAELKPHELEWLSTEPAPFELGNYVTYAGRGCHRCHDSGYQGRIAVYEMMEMTPELMHLANMDDTAGFIVEAKRAFADFTLRRAAMDIVAEGRSTVAEAMRISSSV